MSFSNAGRPLPLVGGVVQGQRLSVPPAVVRQLETYRDACRLAWTMRTHKGLTKRTLAETAGLWPSHVSDYFSDDDNKRELPARCVAAVEKVLGNTIISQWIASNSQLTVLEALQALGGDAA